MKIKNNDKQKEFHEYNEKLKCAKSKLHSRYIASICIGICIWIIVSNTSQQAEFVAQLSMASTVASIILSVIAIVMSISGEVTTEGIRSQMLEITQELHSTVDGVKDINSEVQSSISELKVGLDDLQKKIDKLPDTFEQIYIKNNKNSDIERKEVESSRNWGEIK